MHIYIYIFIRIHALTVTYVICIYQYGGTHFLRNSTQVGSNPPTSKTRPNEAPVALRQLPVALRQLIQLMAGKEAICQEGRQGRLCLFRSASSADAASASSGDAAAPRGSAPTLEGNQDPTPSAEVNSKAASWSAARQGGTKTKPIYIYIFMYVYM